MEHTKKRDIIFKGKEKLQKQFLLQQKTELTGTTRVLQWLEVTIKPLIPEKIYWQCQVALIEAFTNIVRHAHHNLPSTTPIEIKINLYAHYIEMCVWDWGEPFDIVEYLQSMSPIQCQSLEREEGRGLYLINELMDELEHSRVGQKRNCLVMRKLIKT